MIDLTGYDGIIFDMDGTLVDSGTLHEEVWRTLLTMQNIPLDRALMRSLAGYSFVETVQHLLTHFKLSRQIDFDSYEQVKTRLLSELYQRHVKPTPLFAMIEAQLNGRPTAVGTGSSSEEADWFLTACQLRSHIHHIVGCDKVKYAKPAPDTFLACAQLMGVKPERCLVFEDAPAGFAAAKSAGMDVIDVAEFGIHNEYFL